MIITFFGKRGSGKTTSIRALIPELPRPVVILDVLGNFDPDQAPNDPSWNLYLNVTEFFEEFEERSREGSNVHVIQGSDVTRAADFMSSALWHLQGGSLVVDEADAVDLSDAPCFHEAVRYGRNRKIEMIIGCRRPAEISKDITAGTDLFYLFGTHEPRDIEYFMTLIGKENALKLMKVKRFHGIFIDYQNDCTGEFSISKKGKITRSEKTSSIF